MGEKSGVTSPEHVRCSGGKTVCGCKARAQTTRDGTARYGWGKEEAVCEGWDHDRSIAASRAFGNGVQRILFGGRAGSTQLRHNAIHYETTGYTACSYSKEKSRPTELPSRGLPFVENIGRERGGSGEGREAPSPEGPPPLISSYSTPNWYCPSLSRMAHMVIAIMPERNATRSLGRVSRAPSPTSRW